MAGPMRFDAAAQPVPRSLHLAVTDKYHSVAIQEWAAASDERAIGDDYTQELLGAHGHVLHRPQNWPLSFQTKTLLARERVNLITRKLRFIGEASDNKPNRCTRSWMSLVWPATTILAG